MENRKTVVHFFGLALAFVNIYLAIPIFLTFISVFSVSMAWNQPEMSFKLCKSIVLLLGPPIIIICFCVCAIFSPEFLAGRPSYSKLWPVPIVFVLNTIQFFVGNATYESKEGMELLRSMIVSSAVFLVSVLLFSQDDSKDSCLLFLKPWTYEKQPVVFEFGNAACIEIPANPPSMYPNLYPQLNVQVPRYNNVY